MSDSSPQYSPVSARSVVASRRALVGGGTGGIGWEASRFLAEAGADLVIHGKSASKTEARAASLGALSLPFEIDPRDPAPFIRALEPALPADILVVAFGPLVRSPLHETSPAEWASAAASCLALPGAIVSSCLPRMIERGFGRILLFGGNRTDVVRGVPGMTAYAAAKTGVGVIAKSVAKGYGRSGISCVAICPGLVETEYLSETDRAEWAALSPSGRLQDARSVAAKALELALDGSFNGSVIAMDEGFLA